MIDIIPAIDIIDGKCVRLTEGDYSQKKVYDGSPLDIAMAYEQSNIRYLHLVDLDGAKAGKLVNYKILEQIATKTQLIVDYGGGIKSDEDIQAAFSSGAAMVTGGSIAYQNEELFLQWLDIYGSDKIILGADAKDRWIAVDGWQNVTDIDVLKYIQNFNNQGITQVICTDISKDGRLEGAAQELYVEIKEAMPSIRLVASGGVSCMQDVQQLNDAGIDAVIIGKAIYEGNIKISELLSMS